MTNITFFSNFLRENQSSTTSTESSLENTTARSSRAPISTSTNTNCEEFEAKNWVDWIFRKDPFACISLTKQRKIIRSSVEASSSITKLDKLAKVDEHQITTSDSKLEKIGDVEKEVEEFNFRNPDPRQIDPRPWGSNKQDIIEMNRFLKASRMKSSRNEWGRLMLPDEKLVSWCPPDDGWLCLNSYGAYESCRSGFGGLIRDHEGNAVLAFAGACKATSVLQSQVYGLLTGIKYASQINARGILIQSDSKVLVQAIQQGSVDCPCLILIPVRRALHILKTFAEWRIMHVWREANQPAEWLASIAAIDSDFIFSPSTIPEYLASIIYKDKCGEKYVRRRGKIYRNWIFRKLPFAS